MIDRRKFIKSLSSLGISLPLLRAKSFTNTAQNKKMKVAVEESINYVVQLLEVSPKVGSGNGPLVHCIKLT